MNDEFLPACELCGRQVREVTRHHLIPRTRHKNKRNKRTFDRTEVKTRIALLCRPCHKNLHVLFTEKELEQDFNTLETLRAHPEVRKFTQWIRTRPDGTTIPFARQRKSAR